MKTKQTEQLKNEGPKRETPINFLLKNLSPHLACEIKECWIEPNSFAIDTLLDRGTWHLFTKISFVNMCDVCGDKPDQKFLVQCLLEK